MKHAWIIIAAALSATGCSSYQTPGAGINLGELSKSDQDIAEIMKREPVAPFPARLAVARAQSSGYYSRGNDCYGGGNYCVVTARDIEKDEDFERLSRLPAVAAVAPISRVLLPSQLKSIKDLRLAAAQLKADILLLYSLDTRFSIESQDIGPLALISLGFLPNKNARVSTTASAALFDVRTGFVYGVVEATASEQQRASTWSSSDAVDGARLNTEAEAFRKMLGEVEGLWKRVADQYSPKRAAVSR